jgi:YD repeat-containing protein
MKKHLITSLLMLSSILIISSCKDDDDNASPSNIVEAGGFEANGSFVKGTVSTFTESAQAVNYDFDYSRVYQYPEYTYSLGSGTVEASLVKDLTGTLNNTNFATVNITGMQSLAQTQLPDIEIRVQGLKKMDDGKTFTGSSTHTTPGMKITNYKYDASTRTISADFSDSTAVGANGEDVIIKGSFKLVDIKEFVQRP